MNFLEIAQKVGQESGTIPGGSQPLTVTGQLGRLASIVGWAADAWVDIQNHRGNWQWMQREFSAPLLAGKHRYLAGDLGISDFSDWMLRHDRSDSNTISLIDPDLGTASRFFPALLSWDTFYRTQVLGLHPPGRPRFIAVSPIGELAFSPSPDKEYVVTGIYRKGIQQLSADTDIPEMPERFHRLIVYKALILLGTHDESMGQLPIWLAEASRRMGELERDQLPPVTISQGTSWLDN